MHSTFPELDLKNINIPELFENSLPPGDRFIPTSAKMPKKKVSISWSKGHILEDSKHSC